VENKKLPAIYEQLLISAVINFKIGTAEGARVFVLICSL
jgi:hypothetical protein